MSASDSLEKAGLDKTDVEDMPTMDSVETSNTDSMMESEALPADSMMESEAPSAESSMESEAPPAEESEVPPEESMMTDSQELEVEVEPEVEPEVEVEQPIESETDMESESSDISTPPSGTKALSVLNKATNFRKKLTTTKRKLPSLDDADKDKIRTELIHEFTNILKLYKNKTTRKKYIRRLNGLRTVFNQSLNKLNGTTRQRKRKTKARKAKSISEEEEEMSQMSSPTDEEVSQMPADTNEM